MADKRSEPAALQLMTMRDVADHLRCSNKSVQRFIKAGDLPVVRVGRMVRVHPADLERYIKLRRSV